MTTRRAVAASIGDDVATAALGCRRLHAARVLGARGVVWETHEPPTFVRA